MATEHNPNLPPSDNFVGQISAQAIKPARRLRRFGSFLVDLLGLYVFVLLITLGLFFLFGPGVQETLHKIPYALKGSIYYVLYCCFFESIWARTPGKLIFGTVVVNATGEKPTFLQVLGRSICRFIPFEPLSFIGRRGWHDSIPNTYVILAKKP